MHAPTKRALVIALSAMLAASGQLAHAAPEDPALRQYRTATGLLSRGLNDLAVEEYEAFLEAAPNHEKAPVAHYGLAVALHRLGRADDAASSLERIAEVDFEFSLDANLLLGQIRLGQSRHADAAVALRRVVEARDEHEQWGSAASLLVEALHRGGDHTEACEAADAALSRRADDPALHRSFFFGALSEMAMNRPEAAAKRLSDLLDRQPGGELQQRALLLRAQALHEADRAEEAIAAYREALAALDGALAADAASGLADLLRARDALEEAASALDQLIVLTSEEPDRLADALFRRGRVAFDSGEHRRALRFFEQAQQSGFDASEAAWWQGRCQLALEDPDDAVETFRKALAEASPERKAWIDFDLAVALVRTGELDEALELLEAWTNERAEHPLSTDVRILLAKVAHRLGQHEKSIAAVSEALGRNVDARRAELVHMRAESQFLSGDLQSAQAGFERFLDQWADHEQAPAAQFRLGIIAHRVGDDAAALARLAPLCAQEDLPPAFRPALLALGDIAARRAEWSEAERWLSRYLEDGLRAPGADDALVKLAVALREQGRALDALRALDRFDAAFDESSLAARASLERGLALMDRGDVDEADRAFAAAVERPNGGDIASSALAQRGAIASSRGDHAAASRLYAEAADASPGGAASLSLSAAASALSEGDPAGALEILESVEADALESGESLRADALHALALARSARRSEALPRIERLLPRIGELPPSLRSALRYEQAWALREAEDFAAARMAYESLLGDDPDAPLRQTALLELAELTRESGDLDEAARLLGDAVALGPEVDAGTTLRARHALASVWFEEGKYERAAEEFEALLSSDLPVDLTSSALLLAGESQFALERFGRAAPHLRRFIEEHGSDPAAEAATLRLADALARQQRFAEAERFFERFLDEHADSDLWFQARFGLAWSRENQGRYAEAIEAYRAVVESHAGPTAARAQFQIGECFFALSEHEDAVREFLRVDILFAEPEWSAAANYEAGRCLETLGRPAEARDAYARAIAVAADSEWARLAADRLRTLEVAADSSTSAASD